MLYPRLIPSLLINSKQELVKTIRFKEEDYLGDPLNAAYIFSGFEADELLVLDIDASKNKRCISLEFVNSLSTFTKVPLTVGGGISNLDQIHDILSLGVERIALSSALSGDLDLLSQAANNYGVSSISVIINTFKNKNGELVGCFGRPELAKEYHPIEDISKLCQDYGAGEIVINQIDNEGTRKGFDVNLMSRLNENLLIPLVALGGCGRIEHLEELINKTPISGIACGSFFVYESDSKEVLLNYLPYSKFLNEKFKEIVENNKQ